MQRRAFLAGAVGTLWFGGCLSDGSPGSTPTEQSRGPKATTTSTPVELRTDGATATFRVVDGHRPTEDSATVSFAERGVTVEGTMDPSGCREPTLQAVNWQRAEGLLRVVVGAVSPYGPNATVECGNASYDYRCTVAVEDGPASAVEVVHAYADGERRTIARAERPERGTTLE